MIVEQFYLACLAQASYLVGDENEGVAAVIDPRRDVDCYIEAAGKHGVRIQYVLLTHLHADFVSGHIELAEATGATIGIGSAVSPEYDHDPLVDGQEIALGAVRIRVLSTPGHTPESCSFILFDGPGPGPTAVMTGDTLFIGDVGRPDLMGAVGGDAAEMAGQLYDSIHDRLLTLPDETVLYPGHGAGSMCGKNLSTDTVSTIGAQRRTNHALSLTSRQEFVESVTTCQPPAPRHFAHDARMNRSNRMTLEQVLKSARALDDAEVRDLMAEGAQLLDVRNADDFAEGHVPGAVNVGLNGLFATWAGAVCDPNRPILLIAPPGEGEGVCVRLGRVGLDCMAGWAATPETLDLELVTQPRMTPAELETRAQEGDIVILDVRGPGEYSDGHLSGSCSVPLPTLPDRLDDVPRDQPVAVHCLSGYRSSTAVSLLRREGFDNVIDVVGGYERWAAEGRPVVR